MASARYNGIRLPLLPDDTDGFAAVYIRKVVESAATYYEIVALPVSGSFDDFGVYVFDSTVTVKKWQTPTTYENGSEWTSAGSEAVNAIVIGNIIWSNADIYDTDGSVWFEASEPIVNMDESFQLGIAVGMSLKGW